MRRLLALTSAATAVLALVALTPAGTRVARAADPPPQRRCPAEMVEVPGFCIDRWEASLDERLPSGGSRRWPGNQLVRGHERELFAVSVAARKPQAYVSGAQAAENIAAEIKGKAPQPLSFVWYGQGIALGPHDAVGFATYPRDMAWPLILRRILAVKIRNFFVWYLGAALELERRIPGSFYWNGKGRYAQQKRRQKQETLKKGTDGTKGIKGTERESSLSS